MGTTNFQTKLSAKNNRDYSPVHWIHYFDEAHDVSIPSGSSATETKTQINTDTFRVYLKNFNQPPLAPTRELGARLDPNELDLMESQINEYLKIPTLVLLHGGGYSALTWSKFAAYISQLCQCRILAIDLRGHGDTKTYSDDQMDIDTLVSDVIAVTHATHQICGFPQTPKIVLIGHSMGGAIAVKCASNCLDTMPTLIGFVIIDVVEGTAKDALPLMVSVIKTRPTKFPSLENAIEWSVRSGMTKNIDAARASMPGNLVNIETNTLAIHDIPLQSEGVESRKLVDSLKVHKFQINLHQITELSPAHAHIPRLPLPPRTAALRGSLSIPRPGVSLIEEYDDEPLAVDKTDNEGYKVPFEVDVTGYTWRTNLAKTQPYWNDWFDGLSAQLLDSPVQGKFLLLAGIDRLDKALTIGHMQGKFMMKVLPKCGHAVHEDVPDQVANAIGDFLTRNKFAKQIDN